jgi:hypothetical protein
MALLLFIIMSHYFARSRPSIGAVCGKYSNNMSIYDYGIRHQLKNNSSYSYLPAGLGVTVAPSIAMSPPEKMSRYTFKPLPPLPPLLAKSSKHRLGHTGSSNSLDITATRRISTFPVAKKGRDRRGSIKKIENLLGHKLDRVTRQPKIDQLAENSNQITNEESPQLPEISGLSTLDQHNHEDSFSDIRRYMRSDSEHSLSSASEYSQDNTVEEIVDIYGKWDSWAPNPESPTSPVKRSMYLQPSIYSTSATELGYSSHTANVRRPSRASLDCAQISPKATTLAELITEERERFGANSPRDKGRFSQGDMTTSVHDQISPKANTFGYPPRNQHDVHRRNFTPRPRALRPKGFHEPHRSMSQWSDHSSDGGVVSNARDSVISHIRSVSSSFKVPSRSSMVFKGKAATSTIQLPTPESVTRQRVFSSGKHPLKSLFPFSSPLHKKAHSDDSPNPRRSSFARCLSDSFKNFSGTRNSPIISNHVRTGDGPDTPMPTKSGLMSTTSPTVVFFQKGTLQIHDAMQKAKRVAKVKSRNERRRDKLRKKIVVVGTADPSPTVSRWV